MNFCDDECADAFESLFECRPDKSFDVQEEQAAEEISADVGAVNIKEGTRKKCKNWLQMLMTRGSKTNFSDVIYGYGYLMPKKDMEAKVNAAFQELRNTARALGVVLPQEIFLYDPKHPKYAEAHLANQNSNYTTGKPGKFSRSYLKGVEFDDGTFSFATKKFGAWTLSPKNLPHMKAVADIKGKDLFKIPWWQYQEDWRDMNVETIWFNRARLDKFVQKRLNKKFMASGYNSSTGLFYFLNRNHDKITIPYDIVEYYKFNARGSLIEANPNPLVPEVSGRQPKLGSDRKKKLLIGASGGFIMFGIFIQVLFSGGFIFGGIFGAFFGGMLVASLKE
jgi:hypothetical protein